MNKIKQVIKKSPLAVVVVGILVAGVASAAFLTVYTTMTGDGNVEQSVVFGNGDKSKTYTIGNSPAIAGNTYTQEYNLKNKSETVAPVEFVTNQCMVGDASCGWQQHDEEGVETSYWSTLVLENKNRSDWSVISGDGTKAELTYELESNEFNYEIWATGLPGAYSNYVLVYYADKQDRFVNWGGDNPGKLIAEFPVDFNRRIATTSGSVNLAMNLPASDDWNAVASPDYCEGNNGFDSYDMCRGAKLWLVPKNEYNQGQKKVIWNNPDHYLYETDLITYHDTNKGGGLNLYKGMLNFFVKNVLAVNLAPGDYQVKTEVVPYVAGD